MTTAISIQNVSKAYRLGVIGHGTLREEPNRIIVRKEAREGTSENIIRNPPYCARKLPA